MRVVYKTKILDMRPSTIDEGGITVIDGYVRFKINNIDFWAFAIEDWRTGHWSLSLKDKTISVKLSFMDTRLEKTNATEKKIVSKKGRKKPCDYIIFGEILGKAPFESIHEENREKFENIYVDCGFVVKMSAKKEEFKIGDYIRAEGRLDAIRAEGRLDAHLVKSDDEK